MALAEPGAEGAERLFVAVPLIEATRRALAAYIRRATRGRPLPGRAVPARNWHITLRFLGDTRPPERDRLVAALAGSPLGPAFDLTFNGLGAFPNPARARVLWVGVDEGRAALRALAGTLEERAVAAGFPPAARPFDAHLTLSRLRAPGDLRQLVMVSPGSDVGQHVDRVVLYRSRLGPGPAVYEAMATFRLDGPALHR